MNFSFYISLAIFLAVYILISTEKAERTKIVFAGAVLVVLLKILDFQEAVGAIDFGTIFLLMGMMIIVNITKESGLFEFIAIKGVHFSGGDPWKLLVIFSVLTAIVSAFLDNVTTVLLFTPIVLFVAEIYEIRPMPYLITEILSSNIGGCATLIGDPPNIIIAGETGFSFNEFFIHLAPIAVIILVVHLFFLRILFAKDLNSQKIKSVAGLDARSAIKDYSLFKRSILVILLVLIGFVIHDFLELEPAVIAIGGSALLLILAPGDPLERLEKVEWKTLFFFGGLFILIGALEKAHVIDHFFAQIKSISDNSFIFTIIFLWFSAILASIIGSIPLTVIMIPLVTKLGEHFFPALIGRPEFHKALMPFWWAVAIGANFGGNGTLIGAAANVVVSGIAEKTKHRITFIKYLKYGIPSLIISCIIGTLYIWIRYGHLLNSQ